MTVGAGMITADPDGQLTRLGAAAGLQAIVAYCYYELRRQASRLMLIVSLSRTTQIRMDFPLAVHTSVTLPNASFPMLPSYSLTGCTSSYICHPEPMLPIYTSLTASLLALNSSHSRRRRWRRRRRKHHLFPPSGGVAVCPKCSSRQRRQSRRPSDPQQRGA